MKRQKKECRKHLRCSAPLCPLDRESLTAGVWYPGEPICTNKACVVDWLKAQHKVNKLGDPAGYWTVTMLKERGLIYRSGMLGLNPDRQYKAEIKRWRQNSVKRNKRYRLKLKTQKRGVQVSTEMPLFEKCRFLSQCETTT